ncbi:MAG: capsular polysaccharide synthesis protein [Oscillospiraceae bacterium]|nr:capsular polysaccharide synthesis protein [Oscillospiraceae bacterium]MBQ3528965.1 capsular polysaccharide synthesis protein [Oscillospiraceae bacterium]
MGFIQDNARRFRDFWNYLKQFHQRGDLYFVKNKNILTKIAEDDVYHKLELEYARLIRNSSYPTVAGKPSKKVWICWLQGEENAPELVKACINSVRRNLPDREVVVLTEETIPKYIQFPDYIVEKWKNKKIRAAHYSDLLRLALLCEYGGMWIDATVLCTSSDIPKAITDSPLFVYQIIDLSRHDQEAIIASNWFISACRQQPILMLTRDLLYEYWKRNDCAENYYIFHMFFAMAARQYPEDWKMVPVYNNHAPHTLQFELDREYEPDRWTDILKMSVIHKLNRYIRQEEQNPTFYRHIIETYLEEQ